MLVCDFPVTWYFFFFADLAIYAGGETRLRRFCIFGLSRILACETAIKSNIRAVQFASSCVALDVFTTFYIAADLLQRFSIEKFDAIVIRLALFFLALEKNLVLKLLKLKSV